jgi:hypothetical protein
MGRDRVQIGAVIVGYGLGFCEEEHAITPHYVKISKEPVLVATEAKH